ncbi:hypothetical protein EBS43_07705 [bacterium]|nr:hypothetical protein [bacterium]
MKYNRLIFLMLSFFCFSNLENLAHGSIVSNLIDRLGSDFINLPDQSMRRFEAFSSSSEASAATLTCAQTSSSPDVGTVSPITPESKRLCSPKRRLVALSKLPVSKRLFCAVLQHSPASSERSFCLSHKEESSDMPVSNVRFNSTGEGNSIEEFLTALNTLARNDEAPYYFRLPSETEYQSAVASGQLVFTRVNEWTSSSAQKPYKSKLVLEHEFEDETEDSIILDSDKFFGLNRMYLLPSYSSKTMPSGFRIIIEEKPKSMRVLNFDLE